MCTLITLKANSGNLVTEQAEEFANYYYDNVAMLLKNFNYRAFKILEDDSMKKKKMLLI